MCGDTGVSSRARCVGDTTGPRADNEYAVEPVGVAMIRPSAAYDVNTAPSIRTSKPNGVTGFLLLDDPSFSAVHDSIVSSPRRCRVGVQHHPLLDPPLAGFRPGGPALQRRGQRRRLDLGEIAEQTDVDADDRHPRPAEHLDGAQHRAVAAEAEGQPGRFGVRSLTRSASPAARRRRRSSRPSDRARQPGRRLPSQRGGLDPLVVGDQQHIGHGCRS